ncbi:MAG: hypothetical protein DHS20C15_29590 [Planctomycetota bacterium]|nr:MAG: hypothetical protein DHS20C15_29590 [Planctomycetota bacterium]
MLSVSSKSFGTRYRALTITLALFVQPCLGPCEEWYAHDINSKGEINRTPVTLNSNQLKWAVSRYKPRDLVTGEKLEAVKGDKRLVFRGAGSGLDNFAEFGGISGSERFSFGATIGIDEVKGLRSGVSSSWIYANYYGLEDSVNYQVNVRYDEALESGEETLPGLVARAYQDDMVLGQVSFPMYASLDLRLVQYDDRLDFLARATPALEYGESAGEEFSVLHSLMMGPAADRFELGYGAFGLDKGGEFYLDNVWLIGTDLTSELTDDETFVFDSFSLIGACLGDAKDALTTNVLDPTVDLLDIADARDQVADALSQAISAMFAIKDDLKAGNFEHKAAAKIAGKIGKQTYKKLHSIQNKLDAMLDKRVVKEKQLPGLCKSLESLIDRSFVGRANALGVKAKSYKQLFAPAVPISPSDIPEIFDS